jgi:hypothetical protein
MEQDPSDNSGIRQADADQLQTPEPSFQPGGDGMCVECHRLLKALAKAILVEDIGNFLFPDHYKTAEAIQESSQKGCRVCELFIGGCVFEGFEADCQESEEASGASKSPVIAQIYLCNGVRGWVINVHLPKVVRIIIFAPSAGEGICS